MKIEYLAIAALLIITLGMSGSAQETQPAPWDANTDCEQKQIQALRDAAGATLKDQAELALLKAEAYKQLKLLVRSC